MACVLPPSSSLVFSCTTRAPPSPYFPSPPPPHTHTHTHTHTESHLAPPSCDMSWSRLRVACVLPPSSSLVFTCTTRAPPSPYFPSPPPHPHPHTHTHTHIVSPGPSLLRHELVQVEGGLRLAPLLQLGLHLHHQGPSLPLLPITPPPPPTPTHTHTHTHRVSPGPSLLRHELVQVEGGLRLAPLLQLGLQLHHQGLGHTGQEHIQDAGSLRVEGGVPLLPGGHADDAVVHGGQGRHRQQVGKELRLDVRQHAPEYGHNLDSQGVMLL